MSNTRHVIFQEEKVDKLKKSVPVISIKKINRNNKRINIANTLKKISFKPKANPVFLPGGKPFPETVEENIFGSEAMPLAEENYNTMPLTETLRPNNKQVAYPIKEQWGKETPLLENLERNNKQETYNVPSIKLDAVKIMPEIKPVANSIISKSNNKYRQLQTTIKNTKMTNLNNSKKPNNSTLKTRYNNIITGNTRKDVSKLTYTNLLKERERKKKVESLFNEFADKNTLSKQQMFDRMKTGTYPFEYILNLFYYIETSILVGANIEPTVIKYINNPEKISENEGNCLSLERKQFRKLIGEASREYKNKGIKSVDVQKAIVKIVRYFYDNYDNILTKMDMCDGSINKWMHHAESKYGDWYLKKKAVEKKSTSWWKKLFR